jgi:hypothetical protein
VRDMGCYLEDYWARVSTWVARLSWRSAVGRFGTSGGNIYVGTTILCAAVLATLLMIGGVEQNPGPESNLVQILCSACGRNLSRELNVNRVASGIITAVEMLSFKLRRVENGTATDVDLRDSGYWKRN